MSLEDVLAEDDTYEGRLEAQARDRAGKIAYLLSPSRLYIEPQMRQLVGYMLDQKDWLVDPITLAVVQPNGVLYVRITHGGKPRTAWETFLRGPASPVEHGIMPYCHVNYALKLLGDVCDRAELDGEDADWLMSLPRVTDKRPEFSEE